MDNRLRRLRCASCRFTTPHRCGLGRQYQAAGRWPDIGNLCKMFDYFPGSDEAEDAPPKNQQKTG